MEITFLPPRAFSPPFRGHPLPCHIRWDNARALLVTSKIFAQLAASHLTREVRFSRQEISSSSSSAARVLVHWYCSRNRDIDHDKSM
ncbi:hypothetical protein IF1G_10570 [Cordyceps javanica]|uniref:Uncharacterized protein n=1 Tax=Cordyceps javanica TaxID=43265 RepID=A0A545UMY5_9HYPO|nr:hypothetical protein IF1G_10570 [Cordyceps javanica]TQW02461.1 hypothetical protein IF2G_10061 [Cordyceps javanica]